MATVTPGNGTGGVVSGRLTELLRTWPSRQTIAVTGGLGKSTVVALIAQMLMADGKHVCVYTTDSSDSPPISENNGNDWAVLELGSDQLANLQFSPHIAVYLGLQSSPSSDDINQLVNRYSQLGRQQTANDLAIYHSDDELSKAIARNSAGEKLPYWGEPGAVILEGYVRVDNRNICAITDIKLLGEHSLQNICAAVTAVWQITQNADAVRSVLTTFTGLPHRLEYCRELDGVRYYDDSASVTSASTIAALKAFNQPKVVVFGGTTSPADNFDRLARTIASNAIHRAVIIGEAGMQIIKTLEASGFTEIALGGNTMAEVITTCRQAARSGDIVLFSPGCDLGSQFKDFQDRGEQFKAAVAALA